MRRIPVHLGPRSYAVHVGPGAVEALGPECARLSLGRRAAVVTQAAVERVAAVAMESLAGAGFQPVLLRVAEGEEAKSLDQTRLLWDAFVDHGLDRRSPIVAVGGGVVGDLAGFASATFMRGTPFVQVPTTLLAQVDASVGGKVAVNHPRGKNLIGAFHQPRLVLIDPAVLATLSEREYRSGMAEVVKTAAALNAELFGRLESAVEALRGREPGVLTDVVATCCREKAMVVEQDEREDSGLRMVLNYGHTVGHALEVLAGYGSWTHGEAVAVGMAVAGRLAQQLGVVERATVERVENLVAALGLPTRFTAPVPAAVLAAISRDKKSRDGQVPFVLLKSLGRAEVCFDIPSPAVLSALEEVHG